MNKNPYELFLETVTRALCPLCEKRISDDGNDSNAVWIDKEGLLWEWYQDQHPYPHQTVACRNRHVFRVIDQRLSTSISELEGQDRAWILHDIYGVGK